MKDVIVETVHGLSSEEVSEEEAVTQWMENRYETTLHVGINGDVRHLNFLHIYRSCTTVELKFSPKFVCSSWYGVYSEVTMISACILYKCCLEHRKLS